MTYNEAQQIKKAIALLSESGRNTKLLAQNILVSMLVEEPIFHNGNKRTKEEQTKQ